MARSSAGDRAPDPAFLMRDSSRAIVHLRAQYKKRRLGLIFGSGASKELGFPDWGGLIQRIAAHADVDATGVLDKLKAEVAPPRSLAALTHVMFDHFRARRLKVTVAQSVAILDEQRVKSDWLKIIHAELYRDIDLERRRETIDAHPYLNAFRDIIKTSPLTVNYNFDDTLEKMLLIYRDDAERASTRGYETIDRPNAQFQKDAGVIYHPNGFLPGLFGDGASAEVVFDNDAFQDQLISAATGRYVHLSNHLLRNTCLLIGVSLDDGTLQSMLRQNAVSNPGHIHYVVHYMPEAAPLSKEARDAVFDANYTSYNLYTLFLDSAGIKHLAELIRMPVANFDRYPPAARKFVYYIIGSIGAGKSTATSNFRNLITYDEWIDERLPELADPQKDIDSESAARLDAWVAEQFRKKNYALRTCGEGVHIIDRCPLDPLTFPGDRREKAENLIEIITEDGAYNIEKGQLIMLDCDFEELKIRNSRKHKYWPDDKLKGLLAAISDIYDADIAKTVICTRGRSVADVAREIARVIFLATYAPVDIEAALRAHAKTV